MNNIIWLIATSLEIAEVLTCLNVNKGLSRLLDEYVQAKLDGGGEPAESDEESPCTS
jgi:hypothetical protein